MALVIDPFNKIVSVTTPQTTVLVQDFVDTVRDWEDSEDGMGFDSVIDAVGKANLGGGVMTGIVCTLNAEWQIQFWSGVGIGTVKGGNIVGGVGGNPIKATGGDDTIKLINDVGGVIVVTGSGVLPEDIVNITDAVWDEANVDHLIPGSTGKSLSDASAGSSPSAIADAVWNEISTGHIDAGKAGAQLWTQLDAKPTLNQIEASTILSKQIELSRTLGLVQENQYIDQYSYSGGKLISCRKRIYDDPTKVGTSEGVIATYNITVIYVGDNINSYTTVKV